MSKKMNFHDVVAKAAQAPRSSTQSRLSRAKEVLSERPTGYTVAAPPPPAEAAAVEIPSAISSRLGAPSYMEVPIDLIDDNPYNARQFYLPERVAELAASLAADGQLVPGLAVKRGDRYILIGAHYRKKAAQQAGIKKLKLMVYNSVSDQDLYLLSYKENQERNEQTPIDNAYAWQRVLEQGVYESEVKLAEAVGMSTANVNKTLSIMKLEPSVMDVVAQNPTVFKLSVLYEIFLLQKDCGASAAARVAARVVEEGIGRKEVAAARARAVAQQDGVGPRRYASSRLYRLQNGQVRDWDSGRVLIDVKIESEAERQAFLEEVRNRFRGESAEKDSGGGRGEMKESWD